VERTLLSAAFDIEVEVDLAEVSVTPHPVILSEVFVRDTRTKTQSKDPCTLARPKPLEGISPCKQEQSENSQQRTTARDLQSNNPIQTRLQQEINSGKLRYRIKRGERPEWEAEKVIENELAARILLAFDVKQPWSCHALAFSTAIHSKKSSPCDGQP